ncbi:MAG: hypothetical protein KDB23_03795 [Planctomycetales bacterium]|nr:hypothetical protein [Planctomycetales bacterium]
MCFCRLWIAVHLLLLFTSDCHASVEGFVETFNGNGEFSSINGNFHGLDNLGWAISNKGVLEDGGYKVSLETQPEAANIAVIERLGIGFGSFRERIELRDLSLGDLTGLSSPDSASRVELWNYLGDNPITVTLAKAPSSLDVHETITNFYMVSRDSDPSSFYAEVTMGTNVAIEVEADVTDKRFWIRYDPDIYDASPPQEYGPFKNDFDPSSEYRTFVRLVSGGQGTLSGILDYWDLSALSEVPGDFDGNGALDILDVARLSDSIAAMIYNAEFDLNQDSSVDVIDLSYWLHDLKHTYFGDTDLDGEFSSSDLINVFQAGEYEDGFTGNSTWSTGDWNADGEFTTSDLVVAFQDGGYEQGPREAVSPVPEPSGLLTLLIGAMGSLMRTRF